MTPQAGYRVSPDDETPMPPLENTPGSRQDEQHYPDEAVAELRVVVAEEEDSATCIVTQLARRDRVVRSGGGAQGILM